MAIISTNKKALHAGIGYTIGNILVKGISFISIPIFARLLSVNDYGIVNTVGAYVSLMSIVLGLAVHSSIKNAKIDYDGDVTKYVSSIVLLPMLNTLLFTIIVLAFRKYLSNILALNESYLLILIVAESFGMYMITFYNCILAIDYSYKKYMCLSIIYSLANIVLSIIFILTVCNEKRWLGRIAGTTISALFVACYILYNIFKKSKPQFSGRYWKYALKISLPIIPHGLSQIVLSQFDRLMINQVIGSAEAGLYSFAYNIGTIFQVIANSLDTAWTQWFFDQKKEEKYSTIQKTADIYCGLVSLGAIALMFISPELIIFLGGVKYKESIAVTFPVLLAMYYAYMYNFPSSIEYYYKKTNLIAIGTMMAAGVNILLNAIFIPKYGFVAAAYTTVFCYLLYYFLHIIFSRKIQKNAIYNIKHQMCFLLIVTGSMFLGLKLMNNILIRYILLIIEMVGIGAVVFVKRKELKNLIGD